MVAKERLSDIEAGRSVYIERVRGEGAFRQRISEMGFVKGKKITVVKNAPLKDPVEFSLMGYNVSLRRREASLIEVSVGPAEENIVPVFSTSNIKSSDPGIDPGRTIRVALVGNPNAGKTSVFNQASGSHEHVGNYTGVTISSKTATFKQDNYTFQITDLPGTYSLSVFSPEELFVRDFILEQRPDVVINIIDATNLERNLYLTSQLVDMNVKVVVALNMFDELLRNRNRLEYTTLGGMLGIPFVPTVGAYGKGIHRLFRKVIEVHTGKNHIQRSIRINYGIEVEQAVERIRKAISSATGSDLIDGISVRFIALRLLNRDRHIESYIQDSSRYREILAIAREESDRIEHLMNDTVESVITSARYGFINGALKETYQVGPRDKRKDSNRIDNILTNKYLGFPVFLLFLWIMFSATFLLGAYPQDWIEQGVTWLGSAFNGIMPAGSLKQLISEGIIGGVGGVIVFLPNILILFFFISLMEDTGYMARAAFITDKLMHKIGLHGKSFIPLVMGFGCNVPAIMATRTIESRNNRLLTMLINPFMSCSARLPVYILLIGAIFPDYRGTMLFGIYLIGITMAVLAALAFKNIFFRSTDAPFVMELPPYRIPTARSTLKHMWSKASQYLQKMGGVIMVASILIWALGHYPVNHEGQADDAKGRARNQESSYIGQIGKKIEPAIRPLGFDWKMGICLLTGVAAKEIVVSTMGVIYQADEGNHNSRSLQTKIQAATYSDGLHAGKPVFTPLATFSFILFTLLYFPCIATIAAIYKESGSWKWAAFSVLYTTGLAWLVSFSFYQTGMLFQ
jgi:ferrous iron transport protein B